MMQRLGERIDEEEQYAVKEMHADRAQGEKVIPVLFEEMDGIWLHMQNSNHRKMKKQEMKVFRYMDDDFMTACLEDNYEAVEVTVGKREYLDVLLKTESSNIDEVVVTGVYTRKKESFTGSSQTYKAEELKSVGNQNLIQSLKVLDPAFAVLENNEFGSDPNKLPDLEIHAKR